MTDLSTLKTEGVDVNTIVRLTTFNELNVGMHGCSESSRTDRLRVQRIRVLFRFLFCAPLLVLGIDALTAHERINHNESVGSRDVPLTSN